MISKDYAIKYFIKQTDSGIYYDTDTDSIIRKSDNFSIPMDDFLAYLRKQIGQSFDCIYDDHAYLMQLIKCTECGTVIKSFEDEYDEPNLRCPPCTDYKTSFEYWTKEEIDNSEELQAIIKMYEDRARDDEERYKREKVHHGLKDYELDKKKMFLKYIGFDFTLGIDSITNKNKLQGLNLGIRVYKKDGNAFISVKKITIPLSIEQFYRLFRKPYLKNHFKQLFESLQGRPLYETAENCARANVKAKQIKR